MSILPFLHQINPKLFVFAFDCSLSLTRPQRIWIEYYYVVKHVNRNQRNHDRAILNLPDAEKPFFVAPFASLIDVQNSKLGAINLSI